ncbi:MAG: hypothetical protein HC828_17140 [Blastochloris sp.]|nr:hypothetical protein [Blastochloris sp.]
MNNGNYDLHGTWQQTLLLIVVSLSSVFYSDMHCSFKTSLEHKEVPMVHDPLKHEQRASTEMVTGQTVVGVFDSIEQAQAAAGALHAMGYSDKDIAVKLTEPGARRRSALVRLVREKRRGWGLPPG